MSCPIIFTASRGGARWQKTQRGYFRLDRPHAPKCQRETFYFSMDEGPSRCWTDRELREQKKIKKKKTDKFFTLLRCLVEGRGELSEGIMTVGRPDSPLLLTAQRVQRTGAGEPGCGRRRDIVHCDVSSYSWLIRVIMSPALIYVVILPRQSCIDRS